MRHLRLLEASPSIAIDRCGPRSSAVVAVLERADRLTGEEVEALDHVGRLIADLQLAAWDWQGLVELPRPWIGPEPGAVTTARATRVTVAAEERQGRRNG